MKHDHKSVPSGGGLATDARKHARGTPSVRLSLDTRSLQTVQTERNTDPYNTSGSFDRTKNWARVAKR